MLVAAGLTNEQALKTAAISGVMADGHYYSRAALDRLRAQAAGLIPAKP